MHKKEVFGRSGGGAKGGATVGLYQNGCYDECKVG